MGTNSTQCLMPELSPEPPNSPDFDDVSHKWAGFVRLAVPDSYSEDREHGVRNV